MIPITIPSSVEGLTTSPAVTPAMTPTNARI